MAFIWIFGEHDDDGYMKTKARAAYIPSYYTSANKMYIIRK